MTNPNPSHSNSEQLRLSRASNSFHRDSLDDPISQSASLFVSSSSGIQRLDAQTPTNRAPVLNDRNVSLNPIDEDSLQPNGNVGTLVSSLVQSVNDPDLNARRGVAITEFDSTNGDWWFSIDDGANWQQVNGVSINNALLLAEETNSRLYFQPNQDFNGSITNALRFQAWDLTVGENGGEGDASISGGSTAFSQFSDTATVRVNPVNDTPFNNVPETQSINEDNTLIFTGENSISVNDVDAGENRLQVTLTASNGTLIVTNPTIINSIVGNRSGNVILTGLKDDINSALDGLEFKPNANFKGTAKLTVTTSDQGKTGSGGVKTDTDEIDITVQAVNDPPSFVKGDNQTVDEDAELQEIFGWASRISKGALDEEEQEIEFIVTNNNPGLFAEDGQPQIDSEGTLTYTPAANANGIAEVTVKLTDNQAENSTSAEQKFTIRVNAVNDEPTNQIPITEVQAVNEDEPLVFSGDRGNQIQINDPDAGSNNIQVTLTAPDGKLRLATTDNLVVRTNSPDSLTLTGTVSNINNALNGLSFTPNRNFNGDTTISIFTNDQGASGSGGAKQDEDTINISVAPVNDAPSFIKGGNITIDEDATSQTVTDWATRILAGANDETDQTLTFNVTNDNNALFAEDGQPQIDSNGTLTYTLAENMNGSATVTATLQDSGGTDNGGFDTSQSQTFTINVRAINDAPVNQVPEQFIEIDEDRSLVFSSLTENAIRVSDIDAEDEPIQVTLTTANGTLSLPENISLSETTGNQTGNLILNGSVEEINNALEGLRFTPTLNFNGEANIQVVTNDLSNIGNGGGRRATDNISITVNSINDAPFFFKGNDITISEDAGLQTLPNWGTKISPGAFDELGQNLEFIVNNDNNELFTQEGQPTISSDGTLTFQARENANGIANVRVILQDDGDRNNRSEEQTFTITVGSINDQPVNTVPTETLTINEDQTLFFSSQENQIQIQDIDAGDNPIQVTISAQNGSLSTTNQSQNPGFSIDGENTDTLTLTGSVGDINFALDGLGFTPTKDFNGETRITVSTSDQGFTGDDNITLEDVDIITVQVDPVNDAPSFLVGDNIVIEEDGGQQSFSNWATEISAGAENETQQGLNFQVSNDNQELFAEEGQPTISPDGTLSFKTADNASGIATVSIKLADDGGIANEGRDTSPEQTFTIQVDPVNDAPINENIPTTAIAISEDEELVFADINPISIRDIDDNGSSLQVSLSANDGQFSFGNTGAILIEGENTGSVIITGRLAEINTALATLRFKPNANFNGQTSIEINTQDLNDSIGDTDTININVTSINDAPSFSKGENITVNAGAGEQSISNWATFSPGADNESSQVVQEYIISSNDNPEIFAVAPAIDKEGNLTFTPSTQLEASTTATIGIQVRDSGGVENGGVDTSIEQFLQITVNPITINVVPATQEINEGNSGTTNYEFTINLSAPSTEDITVTYSTADGTATVADGDYTPMTEGTVTFAAGEISKTISIAVQGDTKFEDNQTFNLNLTGATNAALGENSSVTATILNDDAQPTISFTTTEFQAREGNVGDTPFEVQLSLSNTSDQEITVNFATLDDTATAGSDYTDTSGTVTFAPGELTKSFTVNITGDMQLELNEAFQVALNNPTSAVLNPEGSVARITIVNDEIVNDTDFNRDGIADIFWRNPSSGENALWLMQGRQETPPITPGDTSLPSISIPLESAQFVRPDVVDADWRIEHIADFNQDNSLDLLWHNHRTGENAIWMLDSQGQLVDIPNNAQFIDSFNGDLNWKPVAVADFSGDSKVDIYWRNMETGENQLWVMDGFNILQKLDQSSKDPSMRFEGVGDFNNDLSLDVLWRNTNTGEIIIGLGGETPFDLLINEAKDRNWLVAGIADIDGDNRLDIAWRNSVTGENQLWLSEAERFDQRVSLLQISDTNWQIEGLADYSGDGKIDMLWRNSATGENAIWEMDGENILNAIFITGVGDTNWEIV